MKVLADRHLSREWRLNCLVCLQDKDGRSYRSFYSTTQAPLVGAGREGLTPFLEPPWNGPLLLQSAQHRLPSWVQVVRVGHPPLSLPGTDPFRCSQVAMKGLYCQLSEPVEEVKFVFEEVVSPPALAEHFVKIQVKTCSLSAVDTKLLAELKLGHELVPVGRDIAGVILEVGPKVSFFHPDEDVVGILPLNSEESGLCDVVLIHEHLLVHKPEKVTWIEAAGTIRDGLRSYTALHCLSHITAGNTILVMDGASSFGTIAIQLAHHRGAKVISTVQSSEDEQYLEGLQPTVGIRHPLVARVINLSDGKANLVESCMEETGGLGVDIVIDAGVRLYSREDESALKQHLPHKHEILTLLAVGGRWITTEANLQLDPPDSHYLYLKGGSVSFLNDEVWNLSNVQQGKYLHILKDVMEKLSSRIFRPLLDEPIPLYEATVSMEMVQKNQARKKQVIQL